MPTPPSPELVDALRDRGVVIHAPESVVLEDIVPERFEAGAEIYPGCVVRGTETLVGAGAELGIAGGGLFENVAVGRNTQLYGGVFKDAVFLDGVIVRGHAEMRRGTLMEERSEAAHHVGYKMTITLPCVVAGSLINFCDALVAGGTSRSDHTEIGSTLALYNFTPWGDKFASLFGDVPRGVWMREPRIFVGGQTQIVSPVRVGYGALLPAGCAVRNDVPDGRVYGEATRGFDSEFDVRRYGSLRRKFELTAEYIGNLHALEAFYRHVRIPFAERGDGDDFLVACYTRAIEQIRAGVAERIKRLTKMVAKLPRSLDVHRAALHTGAVENDEGLVFPETKSGREQNVEKARRRIAEHERVLAGWSSLKADLQAAPDVALEALDTVGERMRQAAPQSGWLESVMMLDDDVVDPATETLQAIVDGSVDPVLALYEDLDVS